MSEIVVVEPDPRIDEIIWKHVGLKPVREIAALTGLRPEEVLRRKNELLDEVDVLTIQQKRQRLLIELDAMARETRERAAGTIDEFFSGMINSSTGAIKTLLQELARMERQDTGKIEALNQMRVRELLRLVDSTVAKSVQEIATTYDLDEVEIMGIFQSRLVEAAREIETV